MKHLSLFLSFFLLSFVYFAQDTLLFEDFETPGAGDFTLNTSDLGAATTNNLWVENNSYTGGTGSLVCLGFPFNFTVNNTPAQPTGISSANSYYMHILSQEALANNIFSSCYTPADGTCYLAESNFTQMTSDISTTGMSNVALSFWWICAGSANSFGEVYYSVNGGTSWTQLTGTSYFNQSTWTQQTIFNPALDNQATLRFGFRFVNNLTAAAADPAFSIDDVVITGVTCLETTASISATACQNYTSPSGNYNWTSSGIFMDTIPNAGGCDSILTIDLTINTETTSSVSETACDFYTSPSGNYTWTVSGTYVDTVPNANGCDSVITIDLTINSIDSTVNQSFLTLMTTGGLSSYQWVYCDSNYAPIPGATGSIYTVSQNGSYGVIISDGVCTDTSGCIVFDDLGIENAVQPVVTISPNPNDGQFNINNPGGQTLWTSIIDATGRTILEKPINSKVNKVDISAYPRGIYFVKISSEDYALSYRIIVK